MSNLLKESKAIFLWIVIGTFLVGISIAILGAFLVVKGATGEADFVFFGQKFHSTSVGIGAFFIGAAMIVLIIRRVLKSLDHTSTAEAPLNNKSHIEEHLKLERERLAFEKAKEKRDATPIISWRGGHQTGERIVCEFQNVGGPFKIKQIISTPSANISWSPTQRTEHLQMGHIAFCAPDGKKAPKYEFEISYSDKLGENGVQKFFVEAKHGVPQEV
jgi:hypothetical protein